VQCGIEVVVKRTFPTVPPQTKKKQQKELLSGTDSAIKNAKMRKQLNMTNNTSRKQVD
jgi:hypothetical protein